MPVGVCDNAKGLAPKTVLTGSITDGKGMEGVHSCHQVTAEGSPVLTGLLHPSRVMRYIRERFTFLHTVVVHLEFISH